MGEVEDDGSDVGGGHGIGAAWRAVYGDARFPVLAVLVGHGRVNQLEGLAESGRRATPVPAAVTVVHRAKKARGPIALFSVSHFIDHFVFGIDQADSGAVIGEWAAPIADYVADPRIFRGENRSVSRDGQVAASGDVRGGKSKIDRLLG